VSTPERPLRVILADDHPVFRHGLSDLLGAEEDIEIAAQAGTGDEVVAQALEHLPDVVLMDLRMPGLNGIEATRAIATSAPSVRILVLTMHDDDESVFSAVRSGASGYLLKGARRDEILRAVRAVAAGEAIFGPALARRLLDWFGGRGSEPPTPFPELTEREREILEHVASGAANPEIARRLFLAPKTVRNNVSNIFTKLQVTDRAHAIVKARDAGMGGARPQRTEP
jgi:DNA-binding NarL/FixJ family response regulator